MIWRESEICRSFNCFMVGNLSSKPSLCLDLLCIMGLLEKFFECWTERHNRTSQRSSFSTCGWKNKGCKRGYETLPGLSLLAELQLHLLTDAWEKKDGTCRMSKPMCWGGIASQPELLSQHRLWQEKACPGWTAVDWIGSERSLWYCCN